MTKDEARYLSKVSGLGCCICEMMGYPDTPAEIHHIRTGIGAGNRADHYTTIPLCPRHHRLGQDGLHVMGRKAWERYHQVTEYELVEQTRTKVGLSLLKDIKNGDIPDSPDY